MVQGAIGDYQVGHFIRKFELFKFTAYKTDICYTEFLCITAGFIKHTIRNVYPVNKSGCANRFSHA